MPAKEDMLCLHRARSYAFRQGLPHGKIISTGSMPMLDETIISRAIIETYMKKLISNLELDVAIVGAGPSGLVAGYYLAKAGKKVAAFERSLAVGGGMW